MRTLIMFGGLLWLGAFVFHIFFWQIFDWKHDLASLTRVNKAIMQVLNLCLMLCFLIFAYISVFHTDELLTAGLGKSLLGGMALFGLFRAVQQFIFFDLRLLRSKAILFGALLLTAIYIIPLVAS